MGEKTQTVKKRIAQEMGGSGLGGDLITVGAEPAKGGGVDLVGEEEGDHLDEAESDDGEHGEGLDGVESVDDSGFLFFIMNGVELVGHFFVFGIP